MMKKVRKIPAEAPSSNTRQPPAIGDDARAMFKLHALMQDYDDLLKEAEEKKKRLFMDRQKALRLRDEVRFLRRKFKFLVADPSSASYKLKNVRPKKIPKVSKKKSRRTSSLLSEELLPQQKRSKRKNGRSVLDLNQISIPGVEELGSREFLATKIAVGELSC